MLSGCGLYLPDGPLSGPSGNFMGGLADKDPSEMCRYEGIDRLRSVVFTYRMNHLGATSKTWRYFDRRLGLVT